MAERVIARWCLNNNELDAEYAGRLRLPNVLHFEPVGNASGILRLEIYRLALVGRRHQGTRVHGNEPQRPVRRQLIRGLSLVSA